MATSSIAAADGGACTSTEAPRLPYVIYEGDTVICQTSDGRMFFQAVAKDDAIFEEQNKKLVKVTGGLFPDPVAPETGDGFVPDGDNRHYADTNSAQTLKQTDIGELREKGASGKEIIQKLVENSSTWETKTEFSKQKYLKKKQQKYMPHKRTLESIHYMPFKQVRLLEMEEEDVVEPAKVARDGLTPEEREQLAAERAKNFTPEQQKRYAEKKARREQTKLFRQKPSTIREWAREKSDSLVIAANYDPEEVLMALLPYLGRSKPFVVYSEFLEVKFCGC
ncbi:Non-canonical poly(A) RNA polymerase [Phytophthora nicotianae]|uniref:tRNA (adenine(58)-N(1))-methyltransferase non-catalytic subunit TRM6 n=1 Tax=Phytophthora nicotianae TaxID=4792 RepID=A0A0W8CRU5_PHYNI|nr:Non-canonical poly(A) RNA polymerase [Phytophthora nicotianae]